MLSRVRRTLDPYMDVILRLLGFPSVFVGFGEGVCKGQQVQPYEYLEDIIKRLGNERGPLCHIAFSTTDPLELYWQCRMLRKGDVKRY